MTPARRNTRKPDPKLHERLVKEFEAGVRDHRSGAPLPPGVPGVHFRNAADWYNSEAAQRAAAYAYRTGHVGQEDQYDGYVYDMHGNRIGVEDPEAAFVASQPVIRPTVVVTGYKKHEPLALPQYCDSTLRQQIIEARLEQDQGGL